MRWMKWIGWLSVILLVISCFTPWVYIASKQITVSGIAAPGTNFGKPGYFHFFFSFLFICFSILPRIWAKRTNVFIAGFNLAWAIRNYFLVTFCQMGECPEKKSGIYLIVIASLLMLLASMFPDMKLKNST